MNEDFSNPLWDLVLWNGYAGRIEMFRGTEEQACELANMHLKFGDKVIYFFASIESVTLREY